MSNQNGDTKSLVKKAPGMFVSMPLLQQSGSVFVGPGAVKEAQTIGLGLTKLTNEQRYELDKAKRYAMDQSIKFVLLKQQIAHQQNQQKLSMYSQALSLMARVYIGSISFEIREEQIKQNFSVFGPIKYINMSWDTTTGHHKGFAFLEFEVPEAALLAQDTMNGKLLGGRNLKVLPVSFEVGQPANMPQAQPIIDLVIQEAKEYNRIYVASVHPDLTEQDLREVFQAFDEIKNCQLAKQPGKGHRGFGYLEFKTPEAVKEAIKGMNNFNLGGQYLQVGRCVTPPDALTYVMPSSFQSNNVPIISAITAAAVTARIQAAEMTTPKIIHGTSPPIAQLAITNSSSNFSNSFNQQTTSPPSQQQQQTTLTSSSTRKRGFGGYAPIVAAPAIVQPLPVANFAHNSHQEGSISVKASFVQQSPPPPPPEKLEPLPPPLPPVRAPTASFWSQPRSLPPKINESTTLNNNNTNSSFSVKQGSMDSIPTPSPSKSPTKVKNEKIDIKEPYPDSNHMATIAPLPDIIAPKDPLAIKNDKDENVGKYLAITSDSKESSTSLKLHENKNELVKVVENEVKKVSKEKSDGFHHKRKKKSKQSKKYHGSKLNTPQALAEATEKVGVINDKMEAANLQNVETSLTSKEHVEIGENDARNLLMHKLMRTNCSSSSVIVLKNMIIGDDSLDDELDDEIREECQKYGVVLDLTIVQESQDIRIFVKFADPIQAEAARLAMDGRFFDGRKVSALFYDQILYEHKDYTG